MSAPRIPLPDIMVAPNGARKTKQDHPALPMTIEETVATALACQRAGAGGLHAHVRDESGRHVLDAGLYRELLTEMARRAPGMLTQITTEAVGRYSPAEMRAVVDTVEPMAASVGLREMIPDAAEEAQAKRFYHAHHGRGAAMQHILYAPEEIGRLTGYVERGVVPGDGLSVLYVLGRYTQSQNATPEDLNPFLKAARLAGLDAEWMVCAFGCGETACLRAARDTGGKARVGFENNFLNEDGSPAADNAERVRIIAAQIPAC